MSAVLVVLAAVLLAVVSGTSLSRRANFDQARPQPPLGKPSGSTANVLAAYSHLPLIFEPNQGQIDSTVRFLARGSGYSLFLTQSEAVLTLRRSTLRSQHSAKEDAVISMELANSNRKAEITGADQLPGTSNYFIGNDPAQWHTKIPQLARVRYHDVYSGIDLVYYGDQGRLEYDFEIAPGSDPRQVALKFRGADSLTSDANGDLVLTLNGGSIHLQSPHVYQKVGEREIVIPASFKLRANNEVSFQVGAYDRNRTLVIDPVLTYSTYFGGNGDEACSVILGLANGISGCPAVAVDSATNAYLALSTTSVRFPTTASAYQTNLAGKANIFVAKFNNTGNTLLSATYLGGNGTDYPAGIAVDAGFNIVVAGTTSSTNFPTSSTAFQKTAASTNNHVFVSRLDNPGQHLLYSTYLSGNGVDTASGVGLDPGGNAYVTGTTTSTESQTGFPSTPGAYQISSKAAHQFFLTKVNPNSSGAPSVQYSTYFGGSTPSNGETVGGGVAVDANSNAYITGGTNFSDMPVLNAYQGTLKRGLDVFVARFNPAAVTGSQLLYSTYIGGTGDDIASGIAVDSTSAYITGSTTSTDFPAAGTGVFQPAHGGTSVNRDAFLAKLANPVTTGVNQGLVTLTYFSYLGGGLDDVGLAIAVDSVQGARLAGWTASSDFPVFNPPPTVTQGFSGGASDGFVARIDTTATTPTAPGHYSTYVGGSGDDSATSIAVDYQSSSYVAGETTSTNFPLAGPFQTALDGNSDAFLTKLGPLLSLVMSPNATPDPVGVGNQVSFAYTISNGGDSASGVTFTDTLPSSGASFTSVTASPGSCGQATGGTVGCTIGALNAGATATVTVVLTPTAQTTPATGPSTLGNSASVSAAGCNPQVQPCNPSASSSVTVNDFTLTVSPATATVPAGVPATYTTTITPTGSIPNSVSVSCTSGLPTGATCSVTTNPIPNLSNGAVSTVLVVNTTARVTTTTHLHRPGVPFYATWLPMCGLALLGAGLGRSSRTRRLLMGLSLAGFLSLVFLQAGCGASAPVSTTTGTPAGTYVVTVSATSGSATRTSTVTLVVQ